MSWLDDMLPDFADPNSMAKWGGLGNALVQGATPHPGTGMGPGNALLALIGAGMQGANSGAMGSQEFKKAELGNQQSKMMMDYYNGTLGQGGNQPMPGSLSGNAQGGANADPVQLATQAIPQITPKSPMSDLYTAQEYAMRLIRAPDISGKSQEAGSRLMQAVKGVIGEGKNLNPDGSIAPIPGYNQAVGLTEMTKQNNQVHETPGGPVFGVGNIPGFGSLSGGQVTSELLNDIKPEQSPSVSMGPGAQAKPEALTDSPAFKGLPSDGSRMPQVAPVSNNSIQPPPGADQLQNIIKQQRSQSYDPMSSVSVVRAKKEAEKSIEAQYEPIIAAGKAQGTQTGEAEGKAIANSSTVEDQTNQALKEIEELKNHKSLGFATGTMSYAPVIAGTGVADFVSRESQLKGQVFLQAYNTLKGGGAITDLEGQKAEKAIGRLDRSLSSKDYKSALTELEDVLEKGRNRIRVMSGSAKPSAAKLEYTPGLIRNGYKFKGGDPKQQSNWEAVQ